MRFVGEIRQQCFLDGELSEGRKAQVTARPEEYLFESDNGLRRLRYRIRIPLLHIEVFSVSESFRKDVPLLM